MPASSKLNALTGLRFMAAAAIVMHHVRGSIGVPPLEGWQFGQGVSVFFVLSGFVLTYAYPQFVDAHAVRSFYVARVARLWPLHLTTLVAAILILSIPVRTWKLPLNILLLQSWVPSGPVYFSFNAVSWSISTELAFYLAFPFLVSRFAATWHWKLALSLIVAVSAVIATHFAGVPTYDGTARIDVQGLVMTNPLVRVFEFILGMCATLLWQRAKAPLATLSGGAWAAIELLFVSLLVANMSVLAPVLALLLPSGAASGFWIGACLSPALATAPLLIVLSSSRGPIARLLSSKPLVYLGDVSFAIYLTHTLVIARFVQSGGLLSGIPTIATWVLFVAVVLLTASIAHFAVELPGMRLGKWLSKRGRAPASNRAIEPAPVAE